VGLESGSKKKCLHYGGKRGLEMVLYDQELNEETGKLKESEREQEQEGGAENQRPLRIPAGLHHSMQSVKSMRPKKGLRHMSSKITRTRSGPTST